MGMNGEEGGEEREEGPEVAMGARMIETREEEGPGIV